MKLLIVDSDGVGLDLAMRAQEHGHEVKFFESPHLNARDGQGLVERVYDWEKWGHWADVIFPTSNGKYVDRLDYLKSLGYPVFGPSKQSALLEIDRRYGMEMLKKHGVDCPSYKMFKSIHEAEAHCWKTDERYVFKTLGSEEDKSLSYVAQDSADMINTFRKWKKTGQAQKSACMLQTFIPGIEFGVSAWMGKDGFLGLKGENVEHKKMFSGNFGQNTGEMGTLMWYTEESKLFDEVLKPMEKFLVEIGHTGDVDLNCIIDENGKPWVLEWTSRPGWPAFFIMTAQHEEPCQWMLDALQGKDTLKASLDPFVGIVISLPPWPNKHVPRDQTVGLPIQGITDDNWSHLHLAQAMIGKGVEMLEGKPALTDMLVTTGPYVGCVSGSGKTIKKARENAYKYAKEIHVPNPQIRDDIGEKFIKDLPKMQEMGYATSVTA